MLLKGIWPVTSQIRSLTDVSRWSRAAVRGLGALALLALSAPMAMAEDSVDSLFRESWTTRNGLPHNSINAIVQTPEGYIWMATWEGLVRFNGREFSTFDRRDIPQLRDAALRTLHVDAEGRLLLGGARGSLVRQRKDSSWEALPDAPVMVTSLETDATGTLWAGTEAAEIFRVDASGAPSTLEPAADDGFGSTFDVLRDARDRLWAATAGGLRIIDADGIRRPDASGLPLGPVTALANDADGRLLAGTSSGLFVSDTSTDALVFGLLAPELAGTTISSLLPDAKGGLWIGTLNDGLMHWNGQSLSRLGVGPDKPSTRIMSLYLDREEHLWVGTNSGLFRLTNAAFSSVTRQQGLGDDYIRAMLPEPDGGLLLGTSQGLARIEATGRARPIAQGTPLERASILSLANEGPGRTWVGTYSAGLMLWDGQSVIQRIDRNNGLPSNEVRAIVPDGSGGLWVGTTLGLAHWQKGRIDQWTTENGLPSNFVIALNLDDRGRLWVGTGVGAVLLENGTLRDLALSQPNDAEYAFDFLRDAGHQSVWVASDRGLLRFNEEGEATGAIGLQNDLPFEKVFGLLLDANENLWLSGNRGMVRMPLANAHAVADGRITRVDAEHFTEVDGMVSAQGNGGSQPVTALDTRGHPWFATAIGAVRADPQDLEQRTRRAPPVVVEAFQADGINVPLKEGVSLVLPAGTRRLELRYAGLGFLIPERLRYRYRLVGFEDAWVERVGRTVAEFTGLPPGRYRFEVESAHPRGEWGERRAVVEFEVPPQWWERRWLQAMTVGIALLLAWLMYRLRLRQLMHREQQLAALVEERTTQIERQKSQLRDQAQEFERQALEDSLTGIPNRRAFDEQFSRECARAMRSGDPLSVIVADIDRFKAINDRWTHAIGDEVLRRIAAALHKQCRPFDTIARWGGEEFALLLPSTPRDEALRVAERLRQSIEALDFSDIDAELHVTMSFGLNTRVVAAANDQDALMRRADEALYRAKENGRNRVEG